MPDDPLAVEEVIPSEEEAPPLFDDGVPSIIMSQDSRDEILLPKLRNQFSTFKQSRETVMDPTWDECYRLYRSQEPAPNRLGDWKSRVLPPYGFTNVEDVVPHLMEGSFGGEPVFKITDTKTPRMAEAHNRLCQQQWNDLMDMEMAWEETQRMKAMYGTGAGFLGFKSMFSKRRFWEQKVSPQDPTLSALVVSEHEFPAYIGNFYEAVHLYNLYPHPKATIDRLLALFWAQKRTLKEIEDMLSGLGTLRNMDKIRGDKRLQSWGTSDETGPEWARDYPGEKNRLVQGDESDDGEYRCLIKFDDLNKTMCALVGPEGSEMVVMETDYPYFHNQCPIIFDRYTVVPKEFWGLGVIEPNISSIHDATLIRNQRRDNVTMAMNGMLEVRENEIDDEEAELVSRPMGVVHSRSGKAITPITFPVVTADALREEDVVRGDIRAVTGLGGPLSGQTDPNSPSGTKFSLQQKGQLLRLSRAIKGQARAIKKIVYMMDSNNQQFFPVKECQMVLGPQMFENWDSMADKPSTINLHSTISVKTMGLFANEDVIRQQYTNFMNIVATLPGALSMVNMREMVKSGLALFPDLPNADLILKDQNLMPDVFEHHLAHQENLLMAQGQRCPPATPDEDKSIHMAHHYDLLNSRPDLFMVVGEHIQSHEQAEAMRLQMELQSQLQMTQGGGGRPNGPGSAPGGQGGGVNPARQAAPTSQEGVFRGAARQQGRVGA